MSDTTQPLLGKMFSAADSYKRYLSDLVRNPISKAQQLVDNTLNQLMGREAFGARPLTEDEKITSALGVLPATAGTILMHGGPLPVPSVDLSKLRNAVQGTGFYTSNKLTTPQVFARNSAEYAPRGVGSISVYDLPEELYKSALRVSDRPLSKQPEVADRLMELFKKDEGARRAVVDLAKFRAQGVDKSADELVTGNLVDAALRKYYGGYDALHEKLTTVGIPARTWQYSHERPAELATMVFPGYTDKLEFIGSTPIGGDIQGFRLASQIIKNLVADR